MIVLAGPHAALTGSMSTRIDADTAQRRHALRSRAWVASLADAFREYYRADPDMGVLSTYDPSHPHEFA